MHPGLEASHPYPATGNARMSGIAVMQAASMAGRKLTTSEIRVVGRGLTPCIPTLAKIAVLANPKAARKASPTASMDDITCLSGYP